LTDESIFEVMVDSSFFDDWVIIDNNKSKLPLNFTQELEQSDNIDTKKQSCLLIGKNNDVSEEIYL
jgi:hypothetical protein